MRIRSLSCGATVLTAGLLAWAGCSKSDDLSEAPPPRNPQEAASQLQETFETAAPEIKQNATLASEAMQKGDFEKAVVSLQVIQAREQLTLEQGLAIHHSMVAMEAKLIRAMEAGDPNAKRAYQLLREMKRK